MARKRASRNKGKSPDTRGSTHEESHTSDISDPPENLQDPYSQEVGYQPPANTEEESEGVEEVEEGNEMPEWGLSATEGEVHSPQTTEDPDPVLQLAPTGRGRLFPPT
jgi:hypothetical protein